MLCCLPFGRWRDKHLQPTPYELPPVDHKPATEEQETVTVSAVSMAQTQTQAATVTPGASSPPGATTNLWSTRAGAGTMSTAVTATRPPTLTPSPPLTASPALAGAMSTATTSPGTSPGPRTETGGNPTNSGRSSSASSATLTNHDDDPSICPHTRLRFLSISYSPAAAGKALATNSLAQLDDLRARFRGPIPPLILLQASEREGVLSVLARTPELTPTPRSLPVHPPIVVGNFLLQGRIWSAFAADSVSPYDERRASTGQPLGTTPALAARFPPSALAATPYLPAGPDDPSTSGPRPASTSRRVISDPRLPPLVAKFAVPAAHATPTADVYVEIAREAWLYAHNLEGLQGAVVPRWYGVYHARQAVRGGRGTAEVLCALLEHVGQPLGDAHVRKLSEQDKRIIPDRYRELHAAGIIHVSSNPKHWLLPAGAPVTDLRLIDFGNSIVRPDAAAVVAGVHRWTGADGAPVAYSASHWAEAAAAERNDVLRILGLEHECTPPGDGGGDSGENALVRVVTTEPPDRDCVTL